MTTVFKSVTVTRSYEQVVQQIQDGIQSGALGRGQKLPTERELSESFGVGRGVIREAIKVLNAMGLVESRQGSGIYVRDDPRPSVSRAFTLSVSPEEKSLARLFEFRRLLETFAARCAAERRSDTQAAAISEAARATAAAADVGAGPAFSAADFQFHELICAAVDNPYLAVAITAAREMQGDVVKLFTDRPGMIPGLITVAAEHHVRVAEAITAKAVEAAALAMNEHISYTGEMVGMVLREIAEEGGVAANAASF